MLVINVCKIRILIRHGINNSIKRLCFNNNIIFVYYYLITNNNKQNNNLLKKTKKYIL
jgi:hypothetical protein